MPSGQPREQRDTWSSERPPRRRGHLRSPNLNDGISVAYAVNAGLHPISPLGIRAGRFEGVESDTVEKEKKSRSGAPFYPPGFDRSSNPSVRLDGLGFSGLLLSLAYRYSSGFGEPSRRSSGPVPCCTRVCLRDPRVSASRISQPSLNIHPNSTMTTRTISQT